MCQFLNSSANLRTDQYSGSTENRIRLLDEILSDLCAAIGNDRVALRLSPHTNVLPTYGGMTTDDLEGTYGGAYAAADKHKIAYLLVTEQRWSPFDDDAKNAQALRLPCAMSQRWNKYFTSGPIIGASGFTPVSADAAVREGVYDAVCFGRYYISNPDLPRRLEQGLPLNRYSRETFYTQGAEGYTDYPTWDEVCEQLGVEAADYASPGAGASETERAAFEDKLDELVVLSEGKLKYPLVTAKALGVLTSGTGASA
jgi:N-ethylmaleimide reductase